MTELGHTLAHTARRGGGTARRRVEQLRHLGGLLAWVARLVLVEEERVVRRGLEEVQLRHLQHSHVCNFALSCSGADVDRRKKINAGRHT